MLATLHRQTLVTAHENIPEVLEGVRHKTPDEQPSNVSGIFHKRQHCAHWRQLFFVIMFLWQKPSIWSMTLVAERCSCHVSELQTLAPVMQVWETSQVWMQPQVWFKTCWRKGKSPNCLKRNSVESVRFCAHPSTVWKPRSSCRCACLLFTTDVSNVRCKCCAHGWSHLLKLHVMPGRHVGLFTNTEATKVITCVIWLQDKLKEKVDKELSDKIDLNGEIYMFQEWVQMSRVVIL